METEENGVGDAVSVDRMDFMQPNGGRNVDFDDMLKPSGATARVRATFSADSEDVDARNDARCYVMVIVLCLTLVPTADKR